MSVFGSIILWGFSPLFIFFLRKPYYVKKIFKPKVHFKIFRTIWVREKKHKEANLSALGKGRTTYGYWEVSA